MAELTDVVEMFLDEMTTTIAGDTFSFTDLVMPNIDGKKYAGLLTVRFQFC